MTGTASKLCEGFNKRRALCTKDLFEYGASRVGEQAKSLMSLGPRQIAAVAAAEKGWNNNSPYTPEGMLRGLRAR